MATTDKNYLTTVHTGLVNSLERQTDALPDGFNKARFTQNCMTVLQDSKQDYSKCDPQSVIRTLLQGAFLNLDFFSREAYAIVYGNQCTFQTDYKGEIKLAKKYSTIPIKEIYAKVVREGDEFTEGVKDGNPYVDFSPLPFNDGEIIGAFAVCLFQDGSMIYDTMSKADIEHTRHTYSKAANSKAWVDSYPEMCKKTVLRRLCKLIDLDFDNAQQRKAFEEGSLMDVEQRKEPYQAKDVYAEAEVVEAPEETQDDIDTEIEQRELPFK